MLLDDLFTAYAKRRLRSASTSTVAQFLVTLKMFGVFLARPPALADLTNDSIEDFIYARVRVQKKSAATANKNRCNLVSLWRFAARSGIVSIWPDVPKLQEPDRIPVAWSRTQLQTLWTACEALPGHLHGIPAGLFWLGLHSVLWDTGARIGETLSLEWCNVDLDKGECVIRAESRKFKKRDKWWRLHPSTCLLLARIERPERRLVFPWLLDRSSLWHHYRRLLKNAGLPTDRRHKFHCLRRSVASFFEAAGGNATLLLDHSSRDVTTRHYLAPGIIPNVQACDRLFRPDQPDAPDAPKAA